MSCGIILTIFYNKKHKIKKSKKNKVTKSQKHKRKKEIATAQNIDQNVRWMASIQTKNAIDKYWRKSATKYTKTKQTKTKTKQNKTKQNKTKQNKT